MAESTVAPTNKAVVFRGKPQKEYARLYKRGLISDAALRKVAKTKKKTKHSKFQKMAGHNPPVPFHTDEEPGPFTAETYRYDDTRTEAQTEREREAGVASRESLKDIEQGMTYYPRPEPHAYGGGVKFRKHGLPRMR
jgi:hypothetical protein